MYSTVNFYMIVQYLDLHIRDYFARNSGSKYINYNITRVSDFKESKKVLPFI